MDQPLRLKRITRATARCVAMCIAAAGMSAANGRLTAQVMSPATITVTRTISPKLPPLAFKLTLNEDSTGFTRVDILRGNVLVQTINEPGMKDMIAAGEIGDTDILGRIVVAADLNFDGYNDLWLASFRGPYEKSFNFWLYDPRSGRFKPEPTISGNCGEPSVHPEERTVTLYCGNGQPGVYYTERVYRPTGMKFVEIHEEAQDENPGSEGTVIRTTKALRHGKLRVVKREVLPIEDLNKQ